jgi:transposase-like protein
MQKKKLSVVSPAVLPVAERSGAERSEAQRSGETVKTGAVPEAPPPVDAEVPAKAKRRSFTAEYKKRIFAEADAAAEPGAIGALLRREGLYSSQLTAWRQERAAGIDQAFTRKRGPKIRRNAMAEENANQRRLADFLTRHGQLLLTMVELIEQSGMAVDELINVLGRARIEAVLGLSARQVAGEPQEGKVRQGDIVWHGSQAGRVCLKERKLRVNKPRLRKKGRGANKEVPVPAYEATQADTATGQRMMEILLNGVSTRRYARLIPEMADTVGVSRSTVSREAIQASEAALESLLERRFDDVELLVIYLDGMQFGEPCVLAAVGVDLEGRKHVLALREGATENAEAAKDLLEHLVSHGGNPERRRVFVIDGSKALRTAITAVFGAEMPVQRCRKHKRRNVLGRLARQPQAQTASLRRAAWRLNDKEGLARFRQIAGWLGHDYPDAVRSLLEGLEECFTINRLDVPRSLHRCLATRNIVDNPHSGVRSRPRRVCRWRPGMPARWSAAAFLEGEKRYRKIMGYLDLWALKAILDGSQPATRQAVA